MTPIYKRYKKIVFEETISKGAFAEVYKGRIFDTQNNVYRVAIKVLKKKWVDKKDLINRLEDEADLLAQLNHTNIISALGFTDIEERPAIVMEHIDGIDLKTLLKHVRLPSNLCFHIAARVAAALQSAYSHTLPDSQSPLAVIHRDIKPSNVMLTRNKNIKVLDFGASRFNHKARKGHTTVFTFGSPKYMSNERKKGDRGSHSSDIYSLGILLIELLSGKTLTQNPPNNQKKHDHFIKYLVNQISFQLPSPEWDQRARQLLMRMCAFWKNHRFTAKECVQILNAFAQHAKGEDTELFWKTKIEPILDRYQSKETAGLLTGKTILLAPKIQSPLQKNNTPSRPKISSNNQKDFLRTTHPPEPPSVEVFLQQEQPQHKNNTIQQTKNHPKSRPTQNKAPFTPKIENPTSNHSVQSQTNRQPEQETEKPTTKNLDTQNPINHWISMGISACITFSLLHLITYSGLALSGKLEIMFPSPKQSETEKVMEEVDEYQEFRVQIDIDPHYFSLLTFFDTDGDKIKRLTRKKSELSMVLPKGLYSIKAKDRQTKKTKKVLYQINSNTQIHCGAPDGEALICIDHNEDILLQFTKEE
ncbi:MAG: hypothetical protein CL916_00990 [Deltaproteobacteria bacterium]|nr:hypothetical protein [Deltaproteobacteria bacterium]